MTVQYARTSMRGLGGVLGAAIIVSTRITQKIVHYLHIGNQNGR